MSPLRVLLPLATALLLAETAFSQAPANDNFADATDLGTALPATATSDPTGSTRETDEPLPTIYDGYGTLWWKWEALATGLYEITFEKDPGEQLITVYTGAALSTLEVISSDSRNVWPPQILFHASPGATVFIQASGYENFGIPVEFTIAEAALPFVTDIHLSADSMDIGREEPATVTITFDAVTPSHFHEIHLSLRDTESAFAGEASYSLFYPDSTLTRISGDDTAGTYQGEFTLPKYRRSGDWPLRINIVDYDTYPESVIPDIIPLPQGVGHTLTVTNSGTIDETAPIITEFTLTPDTVDVGAGSQVVAFRLVATDDTGIASARINLTELGKSSTVMWSSNGPPAAGGIYEGTFTIRGNTEPVLLKPSFSVRDLGGRSISYSNRDTLPDGFSPGLRIENTGIVDTPPVLERFELSASTVDISDGPQTISVLLEASDPISDISSVSVSIYPFASSVRANLERDVEAGPGIFTGTWEIPEFIPAGLQKISFTIWDTSGQSRHYSNTNTQSPVPAGMVSNLEIVNTGFTEIEAPVITSLTFSPSEVDVSNEDQELQVTVAAGDDSGLKSITVSLVDPTIPNPINEYDPYPVVASVSFGELVPTEGDLRSGTFTKTLTIPRGTTPGELQATVNVRDVRFRPSIGYGTDTPLPDGSDTSVTITNDGPVNTPPQLDSLTFTPSPVDISSESQEVTMRIEVSDPVDTFYEWSINAQFEELYFFAYYDPGFLQTSPGVFELSFTVPRFLEPGDYPLYVEVSDSSGASTFYGQGGNEFPEVAESALSIVNDGLIDREKPVLNDLQVTPSIIDVSAGPQEITFRAVASDDAGVAAVYAGLVRPGGGNVIANNSSSSRMERISGDGNLGTYEGTFTIPGQLDPETLIASVRIIDVLGKNAASEVTRAVEIVNTVGPNLPPVLQSFIVTPENVDVTSGDQTVSFQATATDDFYQVTSIKVSADFEGEGRSVWLNESAQSFEGSFEVPALAPPGSYPLKVVVRESSGEFATYQLGELGFPEGASTEITVENIGLADREFPFVTSVTFFPAIVDVTNGSREVTIRVEAGDDTGLVDLDLTASIGSGIREDLIQSRVSGDAQSGVYEATITVPGHMSPGLETIRIDAKDAYDRWLYHNSESRLEIVNSGPVDQPPVLLSVEALPSTVDVTTGGKQLTLKIQASDDYTETLSVSASVDIPFGSYDYGLLKAFPTESGTYEVSIEVPAYIEPGSYPFEIELDDGFGGVVTFGESDMYRQLPAFPEGSDTHVTVVNSGFVDRENPQLVSFSLTPSVVDVSDEEQEVLVSLSASDDLGISSVYLSFIDSEIPSASFDLHRDLTAGDQASGSYETTITIPAHHAPGSMVPRLSLSDLFGRQRYPETGALLEIINSGAVNQPPVVKVARFEPASVDVSDGGVWVELEVEIEDDFGSVPSVSVYLGLPGNNFSLHQDHEVAPGHFRRRIFVQTETPPGSYGASFYFRDTNGANSNFTLVPDDGLVVLNSGETDDAPPVISAVTLDRNEVDVTEGEQVVTLLISATDDVGIDSFWVYGYDLGGSESAMDIRVSGDSRDGEYLFNITVPAHVEPLLDTLSVLAFDTLGRQSRYISEGDSELGLRIVNRGTTNSPPELVSFTMSHQIIDVSDGDVPVTLRVEASDDFDDIDEIIVYISGILNLSLDESDAVSPGIFETTVVIPQHARDGNYQLEINLIDGNRDYRYYMRGFDPFPDGTIETYTIIGAGTPDQGAPELLGIGFSPNPVSRDRFPATVTIVAGINDTLSGFMTGSFEIYGSARRNSRSLLHEEFGAVDIIAGDIFAGVVEFEVELDHFPEGSHCYSAITLSDGVKNSRTFADAYVDSIAYPEGTEPLMIVDSYNDSYDAWVSAHAEIPALLTSPAADADGDGFANGTEFFLGMEPMLDSNATPQVPEIVMENGQFGLRVHVAEENLQMAGRTVNATPKAQWSRDGQSWRDIPAPEIVDGAMTFLTPVDAGGVKLLRFVVEFAPPLEMN